MMSSSKRKLVDLKVNDNIVIPVPRVDRGPIDCRNIRGIIVDKTVNGYKIGTTVAGADPGGGGAPGAPP